MRFKGLFVFLAVLSSFVPQISKAYIEYTPNQDLAEEVKAHPYRILPRGEHYTLAIDADFFKPIFVGGDNFLYYKWDFYHGNGYWLTTRAEFRPTDKLSMNLKALVTQGTSSNGPVYNAMIVPLLALTYREHVVGLDIETRLSDIGRQTVGAGLFIEDKDTMGGYLKAKTGDLSFGVMVDGTGSFRLDGGVAAVDVNLWDGFLGTTLLVQETDTAFHPPQFTGTLYSKRKWNNGWGFGAEIGGNEFNWGGIAYTTWEDWLGDKTEAGFHFFVKPQIRYYGHNVMGSLAGRVAHNYVSYEQNDKPYTNFMDIMSMGDQVVAGALQGNFEYVFNYFYRVYSETEFLRYSYQDLSAVQLFFFRTGLKFFPFKEREDYFGFTVGNKYLIASSSQIDNNVSNTVRTYTPPNGADLENKPSFLQQAYIMINYAAKF